MKEYIEKLLKEQREICAKAALRSLERDTDCIMNTDSILNAPSPSIDLSGVTKEDWRTEVQDGLKSGRFKDLNDALNWVNNEIVFPAYHIIDYQAVKISTATEYKDGMLLNEYKEGRKSVAPEPVNEWDADKINEKLKSND